MNFWTGIVEDRHDPLKLGRCRVRIHGLHSGSKTDIPTDMLPWAEALMPVALGAGMNGIGITPIGPVEGTVVKIVFKDEYQQFPVMVGVLGGIPQLKQNVTANEITRITNLSQPIPTTSTTATGTPQQPLPTGAVSTPCGLTFSTQGASLIEQFEGFSPNAYYDVNGYAIGFGSHTANGSPVQAGQVCTREDAVTYMMQYVNSDIGPAICQYVQVQLTQQMYDALCSFCYNLGTGSLRKSTLLAQLNAGNYASAAQHFNDWINVNGKPNAQIAARRKAESQYFLSGGIPS